MISFKYEVPSFAPVIIKEFIEKLLKTPNSQCFGQVSTLYVGENSSYVFPRVRTVHLRYIHECKTIGFGTHLKSPKWKELVRTPVLSGCYFDSQTNVQFRWEGEVKTVSLNEAPSIVETLWHQIREDVRFSYWQKYQAQNSAELGKLRINILQPCPTFGVVVCIPHQWDMYKMNVQDYSMDCRKVYSLIGNSWKEQDVCTLDYSNILLKS